MGENNKFIALEKQGQFAYNQQKSSSVRTIHNLFTELFASIKQKKNTEDENFTF